MFKEFCDIRLWQIEESVAVLELGLENKLRQWSNRYEEKTKGWSEEEKAAFVDHYYDDIVTLKDTAPNILRQAMFVFLIDYWEVFVAELCRFLYDTGKCRKKPRQKLYIEHSKKYLIDTALFNNDVFGSEWEFCESAKVVRHIVLHNNGEVPVNAEGDLADKVRKARDFISITSHISVSTTDDIQIGEGFCELVASNIKKCIKCLLQETNVKHFNRE